MGMLVTTRPLSMPNIRPYETIVKEYEKRFAKGRPRAGVLEKYRHLFPESYKHALSRIGPAEFAPDFIWPSTDDLTQENEHREAPACHLGQSWWLFATSGSGDGWLIGPSNEIAFLDHTKERRAKPIPMGISFEQWFQLADLMAQVESVTSADASLLDARFRLVPKFRKILHEQMDALAPGLSKRYPFSL